MRIKVDFDFSQLDFSRFKEIKNLRNFVNKFPVFMSKSFLLNPLNFD